MTRVLVTGAGGFIGSHLIRRILYDRPGWEIAAVDSFRHRGQTDRLTLTTADMSARNLRVITHDLAAPVSLQMAARIGVIDTVFALAAGSHVDTSLKYPREFAENNYAVMLSTLEYVREYQPHAHLILVSTDEVYGPVEPGYLHPEWDAVVPSNPYSASKAAQEALAAAWWRSLGTKVTIVNMHNVYGFGQHPEKFIPKVIGNILHQRQTEIHGSAESNGSRHWLHAADVADALIYLAEKQPPAVYGDGVAVRPNRWNIASDDRRSNLAVAQHIAELMGGDLDWRWSNARPGRDQHYGLDGRKLAAAGWRPTTRFADGLAFTVDWFLKHPDWLLS